MAAGSAIPAWALPTNTPAATSEIVIGQVAPLSGVLASTGEQMVLGGKIYFDAINAKGGIYAAFKEAFVKSAVGNVGSGWTWLVKKADGSVDIVNMGAAGTPLTTGDTAVFTVDVWEHAYYIDYRNLRQKFVETYLDKLANWEFAAKNFG